jgi:hypothetical protein
MARVWVSGQSLLATDGGQHRQLRSWHFHALVGSKLRRAQDLRRRHGRPQRVPPPRRPWQRRSTSGRDFARARYITTRLAARAGAAPPVVPRSRASPGRAWPKSRECDRMWDAERHAPARRRGPVSARPVEVRRDDDRRAVSKCRPGFQARRSRCRALTRRPGRSGS